MESQISTEEVYCPKYLNSESESTQFSVQFPDRLRTAQNDGKPNILLHLGPNFNVYLLTSQILWFKSNWKMFEEM